jgi:hypothetical protein
LNGDAHKSTWNVLPLESRQNSPELRFGIGENKGGDTPCARRFHFGLGTKDGQLSLTPGATGHSAQEQLGEENDDVLQAVAVSVPPGEAKGVYRAGQADTVAIEQGIGVVLTADRRTRADPGTAV